MSPKRIRKAVVAAKAVAVRDMVGQIETLPLESVSAFVADRRMVAAGESFLRRALEALLDLGRHLLAKGFGFAAVEYKEIARALGERGLLDSNRAQILTKMAGYRNRLVHVYDEVSGEELYQVLTEHREEILEILRGLESWIAEHPEMVDDSL